MQSNGNMAAGSSRANTHAKNTKYVTKYRRTKNLIKKCDEISKQCDMDFIIVMHDKKSVKVREVHTNQQMTLQHLINMLQLGTH